MSTNCVVTKYLADINNDSLLELNELRLKVKFNSNQSYIAYSYSASVKGRTFRSSIPVYWGTSSSSITTLATEYTPQESATKIFIKAVNNNDVADISLPDKHLIVSSDKDNRTAFVIQKIDGFSYLTSLISFNLFGADINTSEIYSNVLTVLENCGAGSVISLSDFPNTMTQMNFSEISKVSGNLSSLSAMSNLVSLNIAQNSASTKVIGSIESIPIGKITGVFIGWCTLVTGSITHFNNSSINYLRFNHASVTGSINGLPKTLVSIECADTAVTGDLKTLADAHVADGRTSGTLSIQLNGIITNNGNHVSGTKTIKFGTSMVNPTAEETAQGWQIV